MSLPAARKAYAELSAGGTAGDAVCSAVTAVEDNPAYLSVGYGGLPDVEGHVKLDAAYMDGKTLRMGGVMSVENVRNPILLARHLCGRKTNCFLASRGAEEEALRAALQTCIGINITNPRIVKIKDTLHLSEIEVSENMLSLCSDRSEFAIHE